MPVHLQEYIVDDGLRVHVIKLGKWLEENGVFEPDIKYFDKCMSSGLGEEVGGLISMATALFNTARSKTQIPTFWGVARPQRGGGWMTNEHEQLLVPIRILGQSNPRIGQTHDVSTSPSFVPGKAFYFAPGKLAYIGEGVEFFVIH